jgi:hypothetical protein
MIYIMDKFTYIISSRDDVNGNVNDANNCFIKINSLPQEYNYFKVKVNTFIINVGSLESTFASTSYIHLVADNFISQHQLTSGNRTANVLAVVNTSDNGQITNINNTFIVRNMNGSVINFQLLDDAFDRVADANINENLSVTCWTLILEFEGIK